MTGPGSEVGGYTRIDHAWVPLPDGCRLSARIWMPETAATAPAPAILEYLPYRKSDGTALRDERVHPHFAARGYVSVRVDIRGTGDSEGLFDDEYSAQEHADALAVIDWIVAQPWCDGSVGMMGISWGGFNSLQVAALRPPALKAIVTVCSTDDRYGDDCHYQGGCVVGDDMLPWATSMTAIASCPPDPRVTGDATREIWKARIDGLVPPAHHWLAHQTRDDYWKHGSVCEDYAAIDAATLVVGGWADGYSNAAMRLVQNLPGPRRGLIGPWAHKYPHFATPGPATAFLDECTRWWDHWLRGVDTGVMDEPLLRAWIHEWDPPTPSRPRRSGRWVGLDGWKSQARLSLGVTDHGLRASGALTTDLAVVSRQDTGLESGAWCAYGMPGDFAPDQRLTDGAWVTLDGEALTEPVELFGFPRLDLTVTSDQPQANLCVRLCDVAPDGTSQVVSEGTLNLTHHQSHERPEALVVGAPVLVSLTLNAVAHRLEPGHRVRLALSSAYFPRVWPSPRPVALAVSRAQPASLSLPLLPDEAIPVSVPELAPPESDVTPSDGGLYREVTRRFGIKEEAQVTLVSPPSTDLVDDRVLLTHDDVDRFSVPAHDPLGARAACTRIMGMEQPGWPARVEVRSVMTSTVDEFIVRTEILAMLGEELVHQRILETEIPRHHV